MLQPLVYGRKEQHWATPRQQQVQTTLLKDEGQDSVKKVPSSFVTLKGIYFQCCHYVTQFLGYSLFACDKFEKLSQSAKEYCQKAGSELYGKSSPDWKPEFSQRASPTRTDSGFCYYRLRNDKSLRPLVAPTASNANISRCFKGNIEDSDHSSSFPERQNVQYNKKTEISFERILELGSFRFVNNTETYSEEHPYNGPPLLTMSCLGELGRFGNQLFQYMFLRCCAFRVLSVVVSQPFVICIVAGRSDCIFSREEDAMPSRITLNFLRLDPFSEATVKYFIQNATCHNEPILKVLFPSHPEGHDWFFKQVYDYTGGVPYYVVHVLDELGKRCESWNCFCDLSEDEMKEEMEKIAPNFSLVVTLSLMTPESRIVFSSMLLASIFEFRIPMRETLFDGSHSEYVLDIANHFGFYYVSCSRNEQDEASRILVEDNYETFFKLVFPKIVLKHIQSRYWNIPPFRFICSLFSSISRLDSPSSRGFKFEIIFTLILYVRWCFCSKLGELSIFRHSFVEHISIESTETIDSLKVDPIPNYVPAFSSTVSGIHSANEETYNVTAWKPFFEKYLSKDGIFVPIRQNSNGPDVLIRVTDMKDNSVLVIQDESSSEQTPMETETTKKRVYLIGIALKFFQLSSSGVGRSMITSEVAKFLHPVASQLELEQNDLTAIQLIVSNKYTEEVSRQFRDNQNWILNSGVYYEDNNNNIVYSSINSERQSQNIREEWLWIPPHCQVVVCSTTSLRTFLGCKASEELERVFGDNPGWLEQLKPLSDLLSNSFVDLLRHIPFEESERNSGIMERRSTRPRMDMNVMQMEDTRGESTIPAPNSLQQVSFNAQREQTPMPAVNIGQNMHVPTQSSRDFYWKKFLIENALIPEEYAGRYATLLHSFVGNNRSKVDEKLLRIIRVHEDHLFYILAALRVDEFANNSQ
ncbi:hypothetical protein GpartN1_g5763.t1 [Galdieria partita]|uniref:Uncharacterized protein n=1 Tax=Galdieria partita TaxID=83374 RepID=A0A9C7USS2_9RHOD|nr:hypothetical protein GpartN1_g5763.t1 [Galdieria partita]